jgi:hypothetical protein
MRSCCLCACMCIPPIVARQRICKHVPVAMNTHGSVVFYVVRVVSRGQRRVVLPVTFLFLLQWGETQQQDSPSYKPQVTSERRRASDENNLQGKLNYLEKTCPWATLSTTNLTVVWD